MLLVLLLAPLFTGYRPQGEGAAAAAARSAARGSPIATSISLARKEALVAESASWLFRSAPYLVFAATWVAAALVPTFRDRASVQLVGGPDRDCRASRRRALLPLALAGLDVGTSFGGIGSSREVMIASLAEPAMIMIVFTLALIAGSTQLSTMAAFMASSAVGPARHARHGPDRADHGRARGERPHSRR